MSKKKSVKTKKVEGGPEMEKAAKEDEELKQHQEELRSLIVELASDMRRMLTVGQLGAAEDALLRIKRHREQMGKGANLGPLEYELKLLETDLKLARLK